MFGHMNHQWDAYGGKNKNECNNYKCGTSKKVRIKWVFCQSKKK